MPDPVGWQPLDLPGADAAIWPTWLPTDEADALLAHLLEAVRWETHVIRLFGREVASPRLSCWIGDSGASYVYSRTRFEPHPWPSALTALRPRLEQACGSTFNSVLANLYRDGSDAMGWHSDDEPELGPAPVIASLSLGAPRRFVFRSKAARGPATLELELSHGSLLRMANATQRLYQHALPRARQLRLPRINLTFRRILHERAGAQP
ncbi:alpha-ketoglutarate-dependent dioxygenase AlkB family protein [Frateuria hangzhouensis]|uniref:alpha-ketoglutarate-dependent dioxygenase AlkB family protein n=1 Tax=Frateuria hangzhouensis TaxID=2995589 RepID=UPI002260CAEC|nr:alpha-ketoglutarate-dependent dioxygenase AlkB [Frateuria sp. STR12]MCX7512899.1 alpha-ketoglutarate-dependent dioxygenase AlkB [Frateuria sp. STR12]